MEAQAHNQIDYGMVGNDFSEDIFKGDAALETLSRRCLVARAWDVDIEQRPRFCRSDEEI